GDPCRSDGGRLGVKRCVARVMRSEMSHPVADSLETIACRSHNRFPYCEDLPTWKWSLPIPPLIVVGTQYQDTLIVQRYHPGRQRPAYGQCQRLLVEGQYGPGSPSMTAEKSRFPIDRSACWRAMSMGRNNGPASSRADDSPLA